MIDASELYSEKINKMDYHKFFGRKAEIVAKDLLGRLIVRNIGQGTIAGRIIQTGAYEGGSETEQRKGMKYAPGAIFLMPYRGHNFLNIATGKKDYPSCVEIREVAFHDRVVKGSGAIANHLRIEKGLDGILLGNELQILGNPAEETEIKKIAGKSGNCLGYFLIK